MPQQSLCCYCCCRVSAKSSPRFLFQCPADPAHDSSFNASYNVVNIYNFLIYLFIWFIGYFLFFVSNSKCARFFNIYMHSTLCLGRYYYRSWDTLYTSLELLWYIRLWKRAIPSVVGNKKRFWMHQFNNKLMAVAVGSLHTLLSIISWNDVLIWIWYFLKFKSSMIWI